MPSRTSTLAGFTTSITSTTNLNAGIVTASSFVGNLTGTASTASFATTSFGLSGTPNLNAGIVTATSFVGSLTGNINSSGVSTFTNGPVLVGTGTSTGTAGQVLQVTGISSGAYIGGNLGVGATNPTQVLQVNVTDGNYAFYGITPNINGLVGFIPDGTNGNALRWGGNGANGNVFRFLGSNAVERARVDGNGNFVIGTTVSTGTASQPLQVSGGAYVSGSVGIGTTNPLTTLQVQGSSTAIDTRVQSIAEKSQILTGTTLSLVYNTGGSNIAIHTNPSADVTLAITGIPTDSSFNNSVLTFSAVLINTGTARSCTAVTLNGVSASIKWFGGSLASAVSGVTTTTGTDIYTFTGINTVGSASTTTNYLLLGNVNGSYR